MRGLFFRDWNDKCSLLCVWNDPTSVGLIEKARETSEEDFDAGEFFEEEVGDSIRARR